MKRVVSKYSSDTIEASDCNRDCVYIAKHKEDGKWGVIVSISDKLSILWFDECTEGTGHGRFTTIKEILQLFTSSWDIYQFPDFRSAMQYYLEQTK